ncbi:MAG TPA: hypothetical protein VKB41_00180, partial [Steroidobacteraceae bacterium]|nr:hypothetical protein [Steroidobacteraceae bacterium]
MQHLTAHPDFLPAAFGLAFIALALVFASAQSPLRELPRLTRNHGGRWLTLPVLATLGVLLLPAIGFAQDAAAAAPSPVPNKGDTAWMLTSTALVLLMS